MNIDLKGTCEQNLNFFLPEGYVAVFTKTHILSYMILSGFSLFFKSLFSHIEATACISKARSYSTPLSCEIVEV